MNSIVNETTPLVSVIMSVYKEPLEWIQQSIDSILHQTFSNFEFIIVCDNPNYKSCLELLLDYSRKDSRICLIQNKKNIGLTRSLNKGLEVAKGQFIARMDADDISLKNRLAQQVDFLQTHIDIGVCGMTIQMFGEKNFFSMKKKNFPRTNEDIIGYMLFENPIAHPVVMFRKEINKKLIRYDDDIAKAQDYKLWYDLFNLGAKFYNLPMVGLKYRVSKSQISSLSINDQQIVANYVRGSLLSKYFSEEQLMEKSIHNDACCVTLTGHPLHMRLDWLKILRKRIKAEKKLTKCIEYEIFSIWVSNCYVFKEMKGLFCYPSHSLLLYGHTSFLRILIRIIIEIMRNVKAKRATY